MSTKTINDVRTHLFAVLDGLASKTTPMEIERAKAICEAAQTIINSAKVEVEYVKATGGNAQSPFLEPNATPALPSGVNGTTVHRLRG